MTTNPLKITFTVWRLDNTGFALWFQSHDKKEVAEALLNGMEVWSIDSGTDGNDDVLIAHEDELSGILIDSFNPNKTEYLEEIPEHYTKARITLTTNGEVEIGHKERFLHPGHNP
jgi:hypothetical protein